MTKYLAIAILLLPYVSFGQITIGQTHTLSSEHLGTDQDIIIYLPKDYDGGTKKYPVLYLLDAQWFFLNGVAIQETLRGEELLPEMIIVGLDFKDRPNRNQILNNHWDEYRKYLKTEVTDFVDKIYRTNGDRVLFGWESNAFLVTELLLNNSETFGAAIASNGGELTSELAENFKEYKGSDKYLYVANTEKDIYSIDYTQEFVSALEAHNLANLNWSYQSFNNEIHESLPYLSLYHGLKYYYHNYGDLVYSSPQDFREKGGMDFLQAYYQARGERFGLEPRVSDGVKNSLIWLSWKKGDFESFKLFMKEFVDVLSTPRYASAYWQNRLAQFYLEHGDWANALTYFERGIERYPDDRYMSRMYAGAGKAQLGLKQKQMAKEYFKKAVDFARKNNEPELKEYQALLDKAN